MANGGHILSIAFWLALAAGVGIFGYVLARAVKRWTQSNDKPEAFTLQDLRDMRSRGEITAQEFDTMRAAILGRYAADSGPPQTQSEGPDPENDA